MGIVRFAAHILAYMLLYGVYSITCRPNNSHVQSAIHNLFPERTYFAGRDVDAEQFTLCDNCKLTLTLFRENHRGDFF